MTRPDLPLAVARPTAEDHSGVVAVGVLEAWDMLDGDAAARTTGESVSLLFSLPAKLLGVLKPLECCGDGETETR